MIESVLQVLCNVLIALPDGKVAVSWEYTKTARGRSGDLPHMKEEYIKSRPVHLHVASPL
jgi:hypothetical protein